MNHDEIGKCWKDPHNWKWGAFYCCQADPRVIVPKRRKWMGWTINFARPSAIPVLLALLALLLFPPLIVAITGKVWMRGIVPSAFEKRCQTWDEGEPPLEPGD